MSFPYSDDNKRYHTLSYHNRTSGVPTQKAIVDAGLSCPNIDGSKGRGGCVFCDGSGSYFSPGSRLTVTQQLDRESKRIWSRRPGVPLIAYFQGNTNTYTTCAHLEALLEEALSFPGVAGLSVATRPDCLPPDIVELLGAFAGRTRLTVELGLQTVQDSTAELIHRCYPFSEFQEGFRRLREQNIRICVHLINGLPGETQADMLNTARVLGAMGPEAVKIHLLHVLRETELASWFLEGRYHPMEFEDYINTVVSQLELLPMATVIERITGDGDKNRLLAPLWSRNKIRVLGTIDQRMAERETYQGRLCLAEC